MLRGKGKRLPFPKAFAIVMILLFLVPGCLDFGSDDEAASSASDGPITIEVWHTFAAESKEEVAFTNAVRDFEIAHPNITVEITLVPFGNACLLYTSPSPRDLSTSRMPSSA